MAMPRLATAAVLLLALPGAPAGAQDRAPRPSLGAPAGRASRPVQRAYSFPVVSYEDATGTRQQRRGIIAGTEIARGTTFGLGIFETNPRVRSGYAPEPNPGERPKRSRRAAVGLSWRF
jgi:hypothetical protein